jgi:hypothetical protein
MGKAKKHDPNNESTWAFNRTKKSPDYEEACNTGFMRAAVCEIHHLMCEHALADDHMPKGYKTYIKECLAITPWDIDNPGNLIGLPKKWAYVEKVDRDATIKSRTTSFSAAQLAKRNRSGEDAWDMLPCHQVDHNPDYTDYTIEYVKGKIWDALQNAKDNGPCMKSNPKACKKLFDDGSDKFRTHLKDRGDDNGGTLHCLAYAVQNISANTKHRKDMVAKDAAFAWVRAQGAVAWQCSKANWFEAFSMSKDKPRPRQPPTISDRGVKRTGLLDLVS